MRSAARGRKTQEARTPLALYTREERERRDRSGWTIVQGILAPVQFLIFAVSLVLVTRYLVTGAGIFAANASVVAKTIALYAIMVTGALWEHDVFGKYLFAPAFFWEDIVSMAVIALHTAYLITLVFGLLTPAERFTIALAAYASYAINATQFVLKLRAARRQMQSGAALGGEVAA
ncbi:MAG: 2-vinyl bacteriochlorophyllide hydratase [Gemmatimonadota bacterium]